MFIKSYQRCSEAIIQDSTESQVFEARISVSAAYAIKRNLKSTQNSQQPTKDFSAEKVFCLLELSEIIAKHSLINSTLLLRA